MYLCAWEKYNISLIYLDFKKYCKSKKIYFLEFRPLIGPFCKKSAKTRQKNLSGHSAFFGPF